MRPRPSRRSPTGVGTFDGAPVGIDLDPPAVCAGPFDVAPGDWLIRRDDDGGWTVASAEGSGWVPVGD